MKQKLIRLFLLSAGVLLFLSAAAKLVSSFGTARILQTADPILSIPFQKAFWIVGGCELAVALVCFASSRIGLRAGLVAWMATNFLVYRMGLLWIGYHKPCSCLGNLTDSLHIPPETADTAMKIVLAYLLVGSYATLIWLWRQGKFSTPAEPGTASPAAV